MPRHSLDTITKDLPKLRAVAAYFCCCNAGSLSLSQYSPWVIYGVWRALGVGPNYDPLAPPWKIGQDSLNGENDEHIAAAREICESIETHLVETVFEDDPLAPPFVFGK